MLKQKAKMSSLNPHAEPYIPLQMQGPESSDFLSQARFGNKQEKETPDLFVYGTEGGKIASSKSDRTNSKYEDKEYLMDLIYLTVLFPSTSKQLLVDAYILNKGNLGATIEMLDKGYNGSTRSSQNDPAKSKYRA